ncbi:MAG: diguanylate cyclase [Alphaproteobacteria bacterium]|nr:diguanylate cyclase [Rhodospirillales bacterium]MCW9046094.1 diguanylate cyclase [Alphaproteobacteria bacterium]
MSDIDLVLKAKLQEAKDAFGAKLPEKLAEADMAWAELLKAEGQEAQAECLDALVHVVHKLAGTAPTLGFISVGRIARTIQTLLLAVKKGNGQLSREERQQIAALINDLKASLNDDGVDVFEGLSNQKKSPLPDDTNDEANEVFVLDGNEAIGGPLASQLKHYGYILEIFDNSDALRDELQSRRPSAIILGADYDENGGKLFDLVSSVKEVRKDMPPIILLGAQDTLDLRLQAVRSGAAAFLTNPNDIARIVEALDEFTSQEDPDPYRVLVVEDSQALAELYKVLLEGAGMIAHLVFDPMEIMGPLHELNPDIILMDINMPGCNGIELAQVIRQREEFFQTPIIFLTADGGFERELLALKTGGDDFFAKPVYPELLISSIRARAERARMLSSMISRDSMTGLANHTKIKEMLGDEFARSKRFKQPLSFAMLDIDNFKNVNDTYGHWTGDTVIKSLAQVLRQRLRRSDIIGRYGGEEFAIILPNTDGDTAVQVLDKIRRGFGKVKQHSENEEFVTTFSCGVADFPTIDDPAEINKKADEALYEAKHAGRNCVKKATGE